MITLFIDEDWTGVSHEQIKSRVIAEFKNKEMPKDKDIQAMVAEIKIPVFSCL